MTQAQETSTDLVVLQDLKPTKLFNEGGLKLVINEIRNKAKAFPVDLTTPKGRAEIASVAAKVSRSKTFLEKMAKDHVADLKAQIKPVDDARIAMVKELDSVRDEVRKPLTDWEAAEAERVAMIQKSLNAVKNYHDLPINCDSAFIKERIAKLSEPTKVNWQEFLADYEAARAISLQLLERQLESKIKYEADQKELAELRAQAAAAKAKEEVAMPETTRTEAEAIAKDVFVGETVPAKFIQNQFSVETRFEARIISPDHTGNSELAADLQKFLRERGLENIKIEITDI